VIELRAVSGNVHYSDVTRLLWTLPDSAIKPADPKENLMITRHRLSKPVTSFVCLCLTSTVLGVAGCSSVVGSPLTKPLTGVGDKAAWGSDVGYPTISALKGDVYCTVSTADDATQLTIIGGPGDPLPQGSAAQQAQYAQLEGRLCTDLFAVVQ
jgi:hypothetical protein